MGVKGPTQVSFVFNQRLWPGAGDIDDCWVVSAIQCANVSAPWLYLPTVPQFRTAAGDPDDGKSDGGNVDEIVKGVTTLWPAFAGKLKVLKGAAYDTLVDHVLKGRPVSLCIDSSKLPSALQHGFTGMHQVSFVLKDAPDGARLYANPLAKVYSRWERIEKLAVLRPAILAYGKQRIGRESVFAVVFPSEAEMVGQWQIAREYAAKVSDLHNAQLIEERDEAKANEKIMRDQLTAASTIAAAAIDDAKAARAALDAYIERFDPSEPPPGG